MRGEGAPRPSMSISERLQKRLAEEQAKKEQSTDGSRTHGQESGPTSYKEWKARRDAEAGQQQTSVRGSRTGGRVYNPPTQRQEQAPEPVSPREARRTPVRQSEVTAPLPRVDQVRRPSQADAEGRRRLIRNQMRELRAKVDQANQESRRLRQEGFAWEAETKEATARALERARQQLEQQLSEIPPDA